MSHNFKDTWETYVSAWNVTDATQKRALFAQCLDPACQYIDPLIKTKGWDELETYMLDFLEKMPGGHFVTTYFLAHSHKSIAKWEMRNADNIVLGEGIGCGEYHENGNLIAMTGFFETPPM